MIKTNFSFSESKHRIFLNEDFKSPSDRGIRIYSKCWGFLARIFGFATLLKSGNKVWIINKKSFKNWVVKEGKQTSPSSGPFKLDAWLKKKQKANHDISNRGAGEKHPLCLLNEDVCRLIIDQLPKRDLSSLAGVQKVQTLLTQIAAKKLLAKNPSKVMSKEAVVSLALRVGKDLQTLDLSHLAVTDEDLQEISLHCPNLETLVLVRCRQKRAQHAGHDDTGSFTNKGLSSLPLKLKSLTISHHSPLTGDFIEKLPPNLDELSLWWFRDLSDGDLEAMPTKLSSLTLNLCGNKYTDAGIGRLPRTLQVLEIQRAEHLSDACIPLLPEHLKKLILFSSAGISPQGFKRLPQSLTHLEISNNPNLTEAEALEFPPDLKELSLKRCSKLPDAALGKLPQTLESLNLNWCKKLTDQVVIPSNLVKLSVDDCRKLTANFIPNLPKTLKELSLEGCACLGGSTLHQLPESLEILNLDTGTSYANPGEVILNIQDEDIQRIPRKLKSLALNAWQLTSHGLKNLPTHLTAFTLESTSRIKGSEIIEALPKTLQYLTLKDADSLQDNDLNNLPPSLSKLDLHFSITRKVTEACVERLRKKGIKVTVSK